MYPDSEPLIGPRATVERVSAAAGHCDILHLATHGLVSARSPWSSAIALADGGALTLADLMGMRLAPELAVLSACESAVGVRTRGEEVLGFGRGLLAAGARRVVVSLAPVDDVATCLLMTELHRRLRAGAPVAAALRDAQNWLRTMAPDAAGAARDALLADLAVAGPGAGASRRRSIEAEEPAPPFERDDFQHPRYWAPFFAIGM
jgi:CHAT domain-containing protein